MATVMAIAWRLLGPSGVEQSVKRKYGILSRIALAARAHSHRDGIYSRVIPRHPVQQRRAEDGREQELA